MTSVRHLAARLDKGLAQPVGVRSLAVVRALVGVVALMHLTPLIWGGLRGDTYHDTFHQPYWSWYPEVGPTAFTALLLVGGAGAVAMAVGLMSRAATITTTAIIGYHLFLSTTHVHNNRAYLFAVLLILSMSRCGDAFSIDSWRARRAGSPLAAEAPAWPLWLLRFECATVYGASGLSKLLDPDWFGGTVTWGRVQAQAGMVQGSVLPEFVADLLLNRSFHTVAAKAVVVTELFIAGGLWWRRTRGVAIAAAVIFHVVIEFSAEVQVFSYLGLAVLVAWAPPSLPFDRVPMVHNRRMASPTTPLGRFSR